MATEQVLLRSVNEGSDTRHLEASLNEDGDLMIEGRDYGDGVEEFFGCREYEWVWTIRSADLAALLNALGTKTDILFALQERFSGERAADLKPFLDEHKIPHDVWSRARD